MRALLIPLLATACTAADIDGVFTRMDVRVVDNEATVAAEFLSVVESAEYDLRVALPHANVTALVDGIIERYDAGVDVFVITDEDQRFDEGIQRLADAGVRIRLNDGALTYFEFVANRDVSWTSDQAIMSHAFVIADQLRLANATAVGNLDGGPQVVFQLTGEDVAEDFELEHNQLFGGSDATALTAFSAPAKSRADVRWQYHTNTRVPYEMWFGPQERVTKRIIDAVYTARRSVRVMTNQFANDGLARALQEKASWGFEVEAIVGPAFNRDSDLGRVFLRETDDVTKLQWLAGEDIPTIILIDVEGGDDVEPRAMVLSHDLYSAGRFFQGRSGDLFEVTTDQLIDGNLSVLNDRLYRLDQTPDSPLHPVVELYFDVQDNAGALE